MGQQVVLIRGVHHAVPKGFEEDLLPLPHDVDDPLGLLKRVETHAWFLVELRQSERNDGHVGHLGVLIEHTCEGVFEHVAVVQPWADHELPMDLNTVVEQVAQPPKAHGPALVAQHFVAHERVGCMNRNVERRQILGDDPLQVGFGKAGEGREISVQERQAVIVVFEVEASPHAFRQLVDETELTVVVAGAYAVEYSRVHLDTEVLAVFFSNVEVELQTSAVDRQADLGVIGEHAVFDDVADRLTVDSRQQVANGNATRLGRAAGHNSDNSSSRHRCPRVVPAVTRWPVGTAFLDGLGHRRFIGVSVVGVVWSG